MKFGEQLHEKSMAFFKINPEACKKENWLGRMKAACSPKGIYPPANPTELKLFVKQYGGRYNLKELL